MTLKEKTWAIVRAAGDRDARYYRASRAFDLVILTLIALNVGAVIIETVQPIWDRYGGVLYAFEIFSVVVFSLEYLLRLWSCTASEQYRGAILGRLRFARSPLAVIDFVAVAPFFLPFLGVDMRFVRILRLTRLFRVAKLGRYVRTLRLFGRVFRKKREELLVTSLLVIFLLVVAASLMYFAEHEAQPEAFPNIPATMWWAVATLTTVGYGDVFPITALGQLLAAFVAVLGIGLFALPAGILASGLVEELEADQSEAHCPYCGERLPAGLVEEHRRAAAFEEET